MHIRYIFVYVVLADMTVVLVLYWHLALWRCQHDSDDSVELLHLQWAMINLFSKWNGPQTCVITEINWAVFSWSCDFNMSVPMRWATLCKLHVFIKLPIWQSSSHLNVHHLTFFYLLFISLCNKEKIITEWTLKANQSTATDTKCD